MSDRGFRYGMAVFESVRVLHGIPLFWEEHLRRLRQACDDREFPVQAGVFSAAAETLRENRSEGFARIYVTAGDGTVLEPATECRIFLLLEPRSRPAVEAFDLAMPAEAHQAIFGGLKTANYWPNIDVFQHAHRKGRHEALLFNEHAELVSACMANVFVLKDGAVRTPALPCGARDGVIREWVIRQTSARECSIFLDDLTSSDEVFLTNSWIGVMPVATIEDRALPSRDLATHLAGLLEQAIAAQVRL